MAAKPKCLKENRLSVPILTDATIKAICDELSKRNLNFVLAANYYESSLEEEQPFISFGVRKQDLSKAIGILETAKHYLINEINEDSRIERSDINNDEENLI